MWIPRRRLGDSRLFTRCRISHSCHALQYILIGMSTCFFPTLIRCLSFSPAIISLNFRYFFSLTLCIHSCPFSFAIIHHLSLTHPLSRLDTHLFIHSHHAHTFSPSILNPPSLSHTHTSLSFPGHLTSVNIVRGGIAVLAEASKGKQGAFDVQV